MLTMTLHNFILKYIISDDDCVHVSHMEAVYYVSTCFMLFVSTVALGYEPADLTAFIQR